MYLGTLNAYDITINEKRGHKFEKREGWLGWSKRKEMI